MGSCCSRTSCCQGEKSVTPSNQILMRGFGFLLFVTAIIEFGIGGFVYSYLYLFPCGAWWGGLLPVICATLGLLSTNRGMVIAGLVIAILAVVVALFGVSFDAIFLSRFFNGLKACASMAPTKPVNKEFSDSYSRIMNFCIGVWYYNSNDDYYSEAEICTEGEGSFLPPGVCRYDIMCVCTYSPSTAFISSYEAVCTPPFFLADGGIKKGCPGIINSFTPALQASIAFNVLLCIFSMSYAIVCCAEVCMPPDAAQNTNSVSDVNTANSARTMKEQEPAANHPSALAVSVGGGNTAVTGETITPSSVVHAYDGKNSSFWI